MPLRAVINTQTYFLCEHSLNEMQTVWNISHWNKFMCSPFLCDYILSKVILITIIYCWHPSLVSDTYTYWLTCTVLSTIPSQRDGFCQGYFIHLSSVYLLFFLAHLDIDKTPKPIIRPSMLLRKGENERTQDLLSYRCKGIQ